jgi:tRNA pseudouridine55 synthase
MIDGVLLLDKPAGITSQTAVSRVKALYNAAKAGHTGTLDPMATGLLPIALGEATKFSSVLLDADKGYLATVRLGLTTTTGDLEGELIARREVDQAPPRIEAALEQFRGDIVQTPPMYSALKHQGRALYTYAREGVEIERAARSVRISTLTLQDYSPPDLRILVACSKGTYIRVLAEDIGKVLGCGATLAGLRRVQVGRFSVADAHSLGALAALNLAERREKLLSVDAMLTERPAMRLDEAQFARIAKGQAVECTTCTPGVVRLFDPQGHFVGIAQASDTGILQPRRLVAQKGPNA